MERLTDEIIAEVERIVRTSQISDRGVQFDLIVDGEGQCKLYQAPFMIVLFVAITGQRVRTYQASDRVFRAPDLQCRFLMFSREVAGLQRSIERCLNRRDSLLPA
jgi:hypothetical protein